MQKIINNLGYRKMFAQLVLYQLTLLWKAERWKCVQDCYPCFKLMTELFTNIVTKDYIWVHQYDPDTWKHLIEWWHSISPASKNFRTQKSAADVVVLVFGDETKDSYLYFLEQGWIVNSERFITSMNKLRETIRKKRLSLMPVNCIIIMLGGASLTC